ncbi:MAG TPA: hypothetical protein VFV38_27225 [Ktedonobacteraceae bacterium]|nr:hypothetical protein [Ktedonobacteraceae bacterium]
MTDARQLDANQQFELEQITERYSQEFQAGHAPKIADYIAQYPQNAHELVLYALSFHCIAVDLPEPNAVPGELSSAAQAALERIRALEGTGVGDENELPF